MKADLPVSRASAVPDWPASRCVDCTPVFPIAIAAGHQIVQITQAWRARSGVIIFAVIAVLPALTPAIIDVVKPRRYRRHQRGLQRIMKVHGRWIRALLLLGAGSFVGLDALRDMPAR